MLPIVVTHKRKLDCKSKKFAVLSGFLGSGIPPFLFALAETKVSSAVAGILNSTTSLFVYIFGVIFFSIFFDWKKIIGVCIGLLGAIITVGAGNRDLLNFKNLEGFYVILATLFYGLNANIMKSKILNYGADSLLASAWTFMVIGPLSIILLFATDVLGLIKSSPPHLLLSLGSLLCLGVLGTAFALILFNRLTKNTDALFSSFVTYLMPLVTITIGFIDGETLHFVHFIGMLLILIGIFLSTRN
jgi:drug/metabolite transporter (DMT)-like permease